MLCLNNGIRNTNKKKTMIIPMRQCHVIRSYVYTICIHNLTTYLCVEQVVDLAKDEDVCCVGLMCLHRSFAAKEPYD